MSGARFVRTLTERARHTLRRLRGTPLARPGVEAVDRLWWKRTILAAGVIDPDVVAAQGFRSTRRALRAYVRGGFRDGVVLNPLFMERLVASQLSDVGRVPALYAYLINDSRTIRTNVSWDAPAYAERHPESVRSPGGPLGHAWRRAREKRSMLLGTGGSSTRVAWDDVIAAASTQTQATGRLFTHVDTVYVCEIAPNAMNLTDALESVVALSGPKVTTVIRLDTPTAGDRVAARLLPLWLSNVRVEVKGVSSPSFDDAANNATLLVRGPETDIDVASLRRLALAGRDRPAAPLWLGPDGTIISAGTLFHDGHGFPLLAGHPSEDALALGPQIPVAQLASRTMARPAQSTSAEVSVTVTDAVVRSTAVPPSVSAHPGGPDIDVAALDALLAPAALRVAGWSDNGAPVLARKRSTVTLADGSRVPSLRWAIKIAAPPGTAGEYWGDTHFARGLADALRRLGQYVVIDAYAARDRTTANIDDVVLALRGPEPIEASHTARSLLWIISHPDEISEAQIEGYGRVFAASQTWSESATRRFGRPIEPLLQCTDTHRFHPTGRERNDELLFVGTARGIVRPAVVEPIRAGIKVRVYGPDWTGYIPASAVVARQVPNAELPVLYETAAAVLNDHWPAMQREGFISNRLFDVVASGGRAVSDEVAGIAEIFGGAVRTFHDTDELLRILRRDLDAEFPAEEELARISARVRTEHSFDARARVLLSAALAY